MEVGDGFVSEVDRRREAVRLVIVDGLGKSVAGDRVGRSRQWVNKWLRAYREHGDDGLEDRSRTPLRQPTKTPDEVVDQILVIRKRLEGDPVANVGALTVLAELERQGCGQVPSLRTIERILHNAQVTRRQTKRRRSGTKLPLPVVTKPGVWQQTDWVQDRYLEGGIRFNSVHIADVGSHGVAAGQYLDRTLLNAVTLLIETAWPALSIPFAMGIDNAFAATTHPNNPFTIWVKACLFFGVEVIISPPGVMGWTNHVEAVNNEWQRKTIWVERYDTINAVRAGSNRAVEWLNTRRPVLDPTMCGTRYPAEYIDANRHLLRWPPTISINDYTAPTGNIEIPLTAGRVTFLRHVTEHHTIRIAHTDWPIRDSVPIGGLVTATITTADQLLKIRHQGETISQSRYPINRPVTTPYYPPADQSLLHHV